MDKLVIVTDGSATSVNKYQYFNGSFGFRMYRLRMKDTKLIPLIGGGGYREKTTVPRCELLGILYGLEFGIIPTLSTYDDIDEVIVVTDSQLSRDSLVLWMPGWIRNAKLKGKEGLLNSSGQPAKNQDILMAIHNTIKTCRVPVTIHHINSHLDDPRKIDTAFSRYNRFNKSDIDMMLFLQLVHANNKVDSEVGDYYKSKPVKDLLMKITE